MKQQASSAVRYDGRMPVIDHNRHEWARMSQDAYAKGATQVGNVYQTAAALPTGARIPLACFDALQSAYRDWLVFGTLSAPLQVRVQS